MDRQVAALAARQHGVVALRQVEQIGLSVGSLRHRLRSGRLHPVMRGVYAVGHTRLTAEGRWMAAVLALGPGAVLSHRSAAALLGIRPTARERIEVTAPSRRTKPRAGIQLHEASLRPEEITTRDAIPVTLPSRTLVDLCGVLSTDQLRRALEQAEILRVLDLDALRSAARGRRGARALIVLLKEREIGARRTRSELEQRFLELLRHTGLPLPETNVLLDAGSRSIEVDCLWRDAGLVVELDGLTTHHTRHRFEADRDRDRAMAVVGLTVVRVTWRQLHLDSAGLARDLERLLSPSPAGAPPAATPRGRSPSPGGSSPPPRSWPSD